MASAGIARFFVDWAWGSGTRPAIKALQRLAGASPDGVIGPRTIQAVTAWVARTRYTRDGQIFDGVDAALHHACDARNAFHLQVTRRRPATAKYLRGWTRRVESFRPEASPDRSAITAPLPRRKPPAKPIEPATPRRWWEDVAAALSALVTALFTRRDEEIET